MKTSTLILTILVIVIAFYFGRMFERMASVQCEIGNLKNRVCDLEQLNARREAKWCWIKQLGSHLPMVGKYIDRE